MALSKPTCPRCGRRYSGTPYVTPLDERICQACGDQFLGLAWSLSRDEGMGEAVAATGWLGRVRTALRKDRSDPAAPS
jgi:hypothetical protein